MLVMMIMMMIIIGIMIVILMIVMMNIVIMMIVILNYIGDAKIDDWDDDSYVEKKDRNDNS